jgi:DNA-binding transcriptional regulator GbsR (MarR family)
MRSHGHEVSPRVVKIADREDRISPANHQPAVLSSKAKLEMIETCARLAQLLGLPRSTGQIYGLLQFSAKPLCLDEIAVTLQLSKGSCSVGTRQLCAWKAVRPVFVQGDRKDHFEVDPDLLNVLRAFAKDFLKPYAEASKRRLERIASSLETDLREGSITEEEQKTIHHHLRSFHRLQKRAQTLIQLVEKAL